MSPGIRKYSRGVKNSASKEEDELTVAAKSDSFPPASRCCNSCSKSCFLRASASLTFFFSSAAISAVAAPRETTAFAPARGTPDPRTDASVACLLAAGSVADNAPVARLMPASAESAIVTTWLPCKSQCEAYIVIFEIPTLSALAYACVFESCEIVCQTPCHGNSGSPAACMQSRDKRASQFMAGRQRCRCASLKGSSSGMKTHGMPCRSYRSSRNRLGADPLCRPREKAKMAPKNDEHVPRLAERALLSVHVREFDQKVRGSCTDKLFHTACGRERKHKQQAA